MSEFASLLPKNSTPLERAAEEALAEKYDPLDASVIRAVRSADDCPCHLLPALAWEHSVDVWDSEWDCEQQRLAIKASIAIHLHKGTPWAVKQAVAAAGLDLIELREGCIDVNQLELHRHNGELLRDGSQQHDSDAGLLYDTCYADDKYQWAVYTVVLANAVRNRLAQVLRKVLDATAPARCHLVAFDYAKGAFLHNNTITRNGEYSRGAAA